LKKLTSLLFCIFFLFILAAPISAHGAHLKYTSETTYTIVAFYDNGEVMSEAQVEVFSPDDQAIPSVVGVTNQKGEYIFTPDPEKIGTWDIQIRKAGHGAIIPIEVGDGSATTATTGYSLVQMSIMIASVVWGLIGTALYFKRSTLRVQR